MDSVTEYVGGAAVAWLVGFTPFLEIYLAVPAAIAAEFDYFSAVFWSVLGNFTPVLLNAFVHDWLVRFERVKRWLTGHRSERFQRSVDRYGGWAIILITPWVGIWVVAATAQALGMKRSVLLGFSLASILLYVLLISAAIAMGRARESGLGFGLDVVSPGTVALFLLSFVLGYLLYATILGALGSLLSRMEDAQQLMGPVYMLLIAGFLLTIFAMSEPDGGVAAAGSYVPFFSPMVMFARAELGSIAAWEIALSHALLAATVAAAIWAAARLYRVGMLMYGKRPSLLQAARLLRGRS